MEDDGTENVTEYFPVCKDCSVGHDESANILGVHFALTVALSALFSVPKNATEIFTVSITMNQQIF
jgi:hypothetical protein